MPRGPFDTTCDLYGGPGSASPGGLIGTFDCRLVEADGIFLIGTEAPNRVSWMTIEDEVPVGPWQTGSRPMNPALADQVAIPSGTAVQWWVLYTEVIDWQGQDVYYRANLVPLPLPVGGYGCSCLGALPLVLGVKIDVSLESPGDRTWFSIMLDPGDYHVVIGDNVGEVEALRFTGACDDLTEATMTDGGCLEFTIDEPDPVLVTFRFDAIADPPVSFSVKVATGPCA